jgi:23S rRNA pseudouridine1911/1915/1917 synthase
LILVARHDDAHRRLAAQFKARMVRKEYLALAHGAPAEPEGSVDAPIGRSLVDRRRMAIRHDSGGKRALTLWRAVGSLGRFSWFRCFPHTGRTHQIRVHLKSIGHPIACDFHYGRERSLTLSEARGRKPQGKEAPLLTRHALHASRLVLRHPEDGRPLDFTAPLPADLAALWAASRIDERALASPPPEIPAPEEYEPEDIDPTVTEEDAEEEP